LEDQRIRSLRMDEGPDTEYKYIANIKAFETFRNIVRGQGVSMPETGGGNVSFTSPKRLDMKAYKDGGLLWSYSVIRVRRVEEVVEEG
jgi:hypothetical protein